jgi:DNA-binding transcriptional regulator PaaX
MIRKRLRYKGVAVGMFGLPRFNKPQNEKREIVRTTKRPYLHCFISNFKKDTPKNLLLIYDIPHEQKRERDWFRRQLIHFGFIMIQKSVWVGPSPLPTEFITYLKQIDLRKKFKTFKLARSYTDK